MEGEGEERGKEENEAGRERRKDGGGGETDRGMQERGMEDTLL